MVNIEVRQSASVDSNLIDPLIKKQQTGNAFKRVIRKLRPSHATQHLITSPSLEDIYLSLFKVLTGISTQFLKIPTVQSFIYKNVKIGRSTIKVSADSVERDFCIEDGSLQSIIDSVSKENSVLSIKEMFSKDSVY